MRKLVTASIFLFFWCLLLGCGAHDDVSDPQPKTYTITFNSNEGSNVARQTVTWGGTATLPVNPTRSGYIFDNWYSNENLTTVYDFSSPITGDITLFAKWVKIGTLTEKLQWLQTNAQSNDSHTIELTADESIAPYNLYFNGRNNITITLIGIGANRTISLASNGSMFTVGGGVTLILDSNITLQGHRYNDAPLMKVNGTFEMKTGVKITGNTVASSDSSLYGSGVYIGSSYHNGEYVGGSFTMNGGEIIGNTSSVSNSSINNDGGGGVYIDGIGTFTMNSGTISGNSARYGGGVYVGGNSRSFGTFIMNGGKISGNTASYESGGGVCVSGGTFTMNGGEISGNTANDGGGVYVSSGTFKMNGGKINENTANSNGGGVYINDGGTFTMEGGAIAGNTASSSGGGVCVSGGTFTMNGGEISGNTTSYGGGVYVIGYGGTFTMEGGEINGNVASNDGGGVYVSDYGNDTGTFRIVNGTVYGSNEGILSNTGNGATLFVSSNGTAQRGKFNGETWNSNGNLYTTNNTIRVTNGESDNTLESVTGLANKLAWLQDNAQSNGNYIISLSADEKIEPHTLFYSGGRCNITITLLGIGTNRAISLSANGTLFTVESNITLVLGNNITLQGHQSNTASLVRVNSDGILIMNDGSVITGNAASYGGGVYVYGGTFTMEGGNIIGNIATSYGGGVYVFSGAFTKTSGTIYGYSISDTVNSNAVKNNSGTILSDRGHAVYVNGNKRKETTIGLGDILSYNSNNGSPTTSGDWDN